MSTATGIEWTDATWNPIRGCSRVSEGCRHCYAESIAKRFSGPGMAYEGLVRFEGHAGGAAAPKPVGWNGAIKFVEAYMPRKFERNPFATLLLTESGGVA